MACDTYKRMHKAQFNKDISNQYNTIQDISKDHTHKKRTQEAIFNENTQHHTGQKKSQSRLQFRT